MRNYILAHVAMYLWSLAHMPRGMFTAFSLALRLVAASKLVPAVLHLPQYMGTHLTRGEGRAAASEAQPYSA